MLEGGSVRVAMLSYRSNPNVGGQGAYVRRLSRELVGLGHQVEVFSGQPYPILDAGVRLTRVPSLDLYREPDPFRTPRLSELRDLVDLQEVATMWAGRFPEPRTFSRRVLRVLRTRAGEFDVIHDNQSLGTALLGVERATGTPLVASIHHPISIDRRIELDEATSRKRRVTLRRWYAFVRMQARVARGMRLVLTPSAASRGDVVAEFGVSPDRVRVVPLGVEDAFVPPARARVRGRILAMASADAPLKGIATLLEAFAKLRTERGDLSLTLVTRPRPGGRTERLLGELGIADHVTFVHGLSTDELVTLMGSAEVACVPSLYEGFSLPTAELMATATPLVVSRAGAIPEVVGPDGLCADLVDPGDVGALAAALGALLADAARRDRYGAAGRRRAEALFGWGTVARATVAAYAEAITESGDEFGRSRASRGLRAHR
jgi:glycosyltransferase involved in cell wall biosynthesis